MAGEAELTIDKKAWEDMLAEISSRGQDVSPILESAVGTIGYKNIIKHFDDESGPDGKWPRRAPSTVDRYRRIALGLEPVPAGYRQADFLSEKVLHLTYKLRKSIMPTNQRRVDKRAVMIFSPQPYSGQHDRGENGMPKREFMWFDEDTLNLMAEAVATMWMEGTHGS